MCAAGAILVPVPCGAVHGGATDATPRTGLVLTGVDYDVRVITADVMPYFVSDVRTSPLHDVPVDVTGFTPRSCCCT